MSNAFAEPVAVHARQWSSYVLVGQRQMLLGLVRRVRLMDVLGIVAIAVGDVMVAVSL